MRAIASRLLSIPSVHRIHIPIFSVAIFLLGCGDPVDPSDFGPSVSLTGKRLADSLSVIRPAWSVEGDRIFFHKPRRGEVVSVDVVSEEVSVVAALAGRAAGRTVMKTGLRGSAVYAAITMDSEFHDAIYGIPMDGGEPELIVDGLEWPWFAVSADETRFAVMPDNGSAATSTVAVYDRVTKALTRVVYEFDGRLLSLSPDGRMLVCGESQAWVGKPATLQVFDLTTATEVASESFASARGGSLQVGSVRWFGSRPRVIVAERKPRSQRIDLSIVDLLSHTREGYGTVPAGEPSAGGARHVAWSSQGAAAIWIAQAIGPQSCNPWCISRNLVHWRLYGITQAHGTPRLLAEMVADEAASWLEFSPDGTRLAYVLRSHLFLVDSW